MSTYECSVVLPGGAGQPLEAQATGAGHPLEAQATITDDAIVITGEQLGRAVLPFVDLMDMRLLNYHLHLAIRDGEAVISQLGYRTEDFFEKLWEAYCAKSRDSLLIEGTLSMGSEGDYAYTEPDIERKSIAKLELYTDCLCIIPHDAGARRVPLCFAEPTVREGFSLNIALDTGERYRIARLGADTDPFFERLETNRSKTAAAWHAAHTALEQSLDARLGDARERFSVFRDKADVACGLFSADDEAFWFAAIGTGRAAVELICDEQTATYLYRFDVAPSTFLNSLRHAMEAVKKNRRIIYLSEEDLADEPLFRMSIERSAHVRFLRSCNAGRIIHTASWSQKVAEFFAEE